MKKIFGKKFFSVFMMMTAAFVLSACPGQGKKTAELEAEIAELQKQVEAGNIEAAKKLEIATLQLEAKKLEEKAYKNAEDKTKFIQFKSDVNALNEDAADDVIQNLKQTLAQLQAAPAAEAVKASYYYLKGLTATGQPKSVCLSKAGLNQVFNFLAQGGTLSCQNDSEAVCAIVKDGWIAEQEEDANLKCSSALISQRSIGSTGRCGTLVTEEITCSVK